jgi:hypothetical protein
MHRGRYTSIYYVTIKKQEDDNDVPPIAHSFTQSLHRQWCSSVIGQKIVGPTHSHHKMLTTTTMICGVSFYLTGCAGHTVGLRKEGKPHICFFQRDSVYGLWIEYL